MAAKDVSKWGLWIHDRYHFVLSPASIYGSKNLEFSAAQSWYQDYYEYAVIPTETNYIDQEHDRCLSQKEIVEENMWQCLQKWISYRINCTLPWLLNNMPHGHTLCKQPKEYERFLDLYDMEPFEPDWIKNIAKCNPACTRYGYTTTNYKNLKERKELDNLTIRLFYNQYEIPVIDHVYAYDHLNLIADFGGYLGLLLGYSILGFYDTFTSILAKVRNILKKCKNDMEEYISRKYQTSQL